MCPSPCVNVEAKNLALQSVVAFILSGWQQEGVSDQIRLYATCLSISQCKFEGWMSVHLQSTRLASLLLNFGTRSTAAWWILLL